MSRTTFEFEVSTDKSKAIIIGPDFITKPLASLFRHKGLSVQTTLTGQPREPVDYIVDAEGNKTLINLSAETGAKYLRLIVGGESSTRQENINWRTIQTDFLVGPDIPENSFMGKLIGSAIKNQRLTLPPPEAKIYPLHVDDLAEACWQALVIPNTSGKKYLILGEPVSAQRLSTYLENLGQTTKGIEVSNNWRTNYNTSQIENSYQGLNWQPNLSWQETVKKGFQAMWGKESGKISQIAQSKSDQSIVKKPEPKPEPKPKSSKPPEKEVIIVEEPTKEENVLEEKEKKEKIAAQFKLKKIGRWSEGLKWWQPLSLILILGLGFLFSVWLKPIFRLSLGTWQIRKTYSLILDQNWEEALNQTSKAKNNFLIAEEFSKNSSLSNLLFGYQSLFANGAELGRKTALASETAIPFFENSLKLTESILKNKTYDQTSGINSLINRQSVLEHQLKEIQVLLKGSWPGLPGRWQNTPQKWAKMIEEAEKDLNKTNQILPHLPWIIGLENDRRTFLVLLQNNMELRPTGGFIGSFALLTFENGQLLDFQVQDVYTADGQLKGYVEPPKQIKEILGEANWYLRDSNWNPDFPSTAKNTEWFLDKSLNRQVDGVIGFNLEAAKKLISGFGEIYLADFNEKISADNIFERAEFWSENEFFPGSNQKAAFLSVMGQQLFENIKAAQPREYVKIGQKILESLEEKEILITTHNENLNLILQQLNWSGKIRSPVCSLNNCFSDYLHLNEANLGVNKTNYFLRRSIEQGISIKESGKVEHQLKINYENSAASKNWPGGDYLAWLRIYLPSQTKINSITVYDPQNSNNKKIISVDDREEKIELGKQVVGFKLEVPIQGRRVAEINFSQQAIINDEDFGYFLYWQKQSGYRNTPVSLLISFPDGWQPLQVSPAANVVSGKLLFNQQLNKDLEFGIQLNTN